MKPAFILRLISGEGGLRVGDTEQGLFFFQDRGGFNSPEAALRAIGELAHERGWTLNTVYNPENKVDKIEVYDSSRPLPPRPTPPPQPASFTLAFKVTPDFDRLLTELAKRIRGTSGQAILNGLTLLQAALDAKDEGKRLVIVDDAKDSEEDLTDFIQGDQGSDS